MSNIALQIERISAGSVVVSGNIVFESTVYTAGNISYNSLTGVITFAESGRYVINWWVAIQASQSTNGTVFALVSSQGDFLEGNSPIKQMKLWALVLLMLWPRLSPFPWSIPAQAPSTILL